MDAQTALWVIPNKLGDAWWLVCAALAVPSAFMILLKLVINEPFNLLTTARVLIAASLFSFGMVPLNSGFLPWAALMSCAGGLLTSVLMITGWCNRQDQSLTVLRALLRWIIGKIHNKPFSIHRSQ